MEWFLTRKLQKKFGVLISVYQMRQVRHVMWTTSNNTWHLLGIFLNTPREISFLSMFIKTHRLWGVSWTRKKVFLAF